MKQQKGFGKLTFDFSPPNEARKKAEAELEAFREERRRRKAEELRQKTTQKAASA